MLLKGNQYYAKNLVNEENAPKSLNAICIIENMLLYIEKTSKDPENPEKLKWADEFTKESNRCEIKFNNPKKPEKDPEIPEYTESILIDNNLKIKELKVKIGEYLGLKLDEFMMKRSSKNGMEIKDLSMSLNACYFLSCVSTCNI